jgi:(p)ppGpp synthase/HD superfamily hydrolase
VGTKTVTANRFAPKTSGGRMIDQAIELAARAHTGQVRKGTGTPYIAHPYAVGMSLARAGCDDEVVAAGILHDTVEDTYVTLEELRAQFGERVASIVEGCTEPDRWKSWEARKQHTLAYLPAAPSDIRLVALADKLHNARSILTDLKASGEDVWSRFKRARAQQEWYYRGLVEALCTSRAGEEPLPFCAEFRQVVGELFGGAVEVTRGA